MQFLWNLILDTFLIFCCDCVHAIKNIMIEIEPPIVERGASALLRCNYDLEGKLLYSVKWYRGRHEFYRYIPNDIPTSKVFLFTGLEVNLEMSDDHQVVLQNVEFILTGNFTCEVSADGPDFLTATVSKNMSVVVLPKEPPTLRIERTDYGIGDTVRANCTSSPSNPEATLIFSLNNMVVPTKQAQKIPVSEDLWITQASTEFELYSSHFREGSLYLHCLAQVTNLYQHDTPLKLDNLKGPVPERVTSENGSSLKNLPSILVLIELLISLLLG